MRKIQEIPVGWTDAGGSKGQITLVNDVTKDSDIIDMRRYGLWYALVYTTPGTNPNHDGVDGTAKFVFTDADGTLVDSYTPIEPTQFTIATDTGAGGTTDITMHQLQTSSNPTLWFIAGQSVAYMKLQVTNGDADKNLTVSATIVAIPL